MKKIILFGLVILVLLAGSVSAGVISKLTALPIETSHVMKVTMISQIPDPAEPGKYVDLRFKFENNGSKAAENMEAEILPEYPFSLDPGADAVKSLGSINPQQKGDNGVIVKYRLRVDKDALEGQSSIKLRYRVDKSAWVTMPEFNVNIQPYDAILLLDKVVSNPEIIGPGEEATIDITFNNLAEILLKKIRVILKLGGVPLAPIGSTNEKVIEKIDKNEEASVRFDLIGEPDAQSGTYKVEVEYIYYDSLGNSYSRNSTIGLLIGSEPDLSVNIDSSAIYQPENYGDVTIKIVNKDVNEIKFLNVKLAESEAYTMISPSEVYVGNIDSDDYETADFTLFVKNTEEKKVMLPITLEYSDANNNQYLDKLNLELPLYSASEAKKLGLVQGNGKVGIFVMLVVVVGGLLIYRRWRKGKKKKA
ncbi:COG1361 S-layer family protein [Candidatus Woesearchaeota archaeon]|nr:COG1361 S-layer family protein [Candidatus Woesearchaeota archaeon]